jgi:hypothetical protein
MTTSLYDLSVNFDYKNKRTSVSLINPYLSGDLTTHLFKMYDEKGTVIQTMLVPSVDASQYGRMLHASGNFGLRFNNTDDYGGYDSSVANPDLYGVHVGYKSTTWEMSREQDFVGVISALEEGAITSIYTNLDRRDDMYLDTPLLITDGDAVTYGTVATTSGSTFLTLTYDKAVTAYSSYNLNNSLCVVLSGANSGDTFAIRQHSTSSAYLKADRDIDYLSGQLIKVMPYRTITSYSGWDYSASTSSYLGDGGLKSRFGFSESIPNGPGSINYTSGTYSGNSLIAHPYLLGVSGFNGSTVALMDDAYRRTVSPGDIVYFTPASAPSSEATGVILYVSDHAVAAEGDYAITYWPARAPTSDSEYKVVRKNAIEVYSYPKFDRQYLCVARSASTADTINKASALVSTPSVHVDFAANEYESQFPDVPETTHFHIGAVTLSNGQTLTDEGVGSNGVLPTLMFSGMVYNGNPNSPTEFIDAVAFSTQNTDAAQEYNGMYFKDGVMNMSSFTTFNGSETLICKAVINYGSIKIDKVFTIPVQPSV